MELILKDGEIKKEDKRIAFVQVQADLLPNRYRVMVTKHPDDGVILPYITCGRNILFLSKEKMAEGNIAMGLVKRDDKLFKGADAVEELMTMMIRASLENEQTYITIE